ncbi:receptor-like protein 12 [Dorcoceras hygrometricum]|uniref:Receptor-like protein 12 n=1 Tax=Dorcoceras hygrometricum TaxID=472368 RepID=A0A2Z7BDU7_9LAMI|nr:receptor-like protein 12 [Dorcoceras hygrometricum]
MKICWFWFELKLLLVDFAFSARLSEEVTRVSQHCGVLTIGFSSCAFVEKLVARAVDRYDDISWNGVVLECFVRLLLLVVAADFYEGKREVCCDGLLLISSIDLGESAGEVEEPSFLIFLVALDSLRLALSIDASLEIWSDELRNSEGPALVSEKSNAIVGVVTTGFECLPPSCDGLTGPDDHGPMVSRLIDRGALGNQAGQSGSSAGRSPHP